MDIDYIFDNFPKKIKEKKEKVIDKLQAAEIYFKIKNHLCEIISIIIFPSYPDFYQQMKNQKKIT